ncbi:MAG: ATP-binding cassette domain-containing protein, partial [Puniceicoccales bacterium]|nr:ATP-binding cassette domain-containing protein [Puniceicoccales bacterium]
MNEEVLRTDKLGKCFSDVDGGVTRVLEEVTLSLNRGERVAVCGESGSGKTTLLSLLGGLDVPSQGEVYWNKRPLSVLSGKDITRKRCRFIHYIFQNYLLVEELSVVENMLLPVRVRRDKVDGKVYRKAFLWLERLGLAEKAKGSPRLLSG